MNNIQNTFSIQDLEILTGVKAHTIRIWEKRYELLNPTRLNRNIRIYSLQDLQKILNVSLLYNNEYKISKISKLSEKELENEVLDIANSNQNTNYGINSFIISMYSFDEGLFNETYNKLIEEQPFEELFMETFLPVLNHIGVLWQTDSITPAHEHFISHLIYQKLVLQTAKLPNIKKDKQELIHVLYLPEGEIHELGLMFLHYYLKRIGKQVIYLGTSIPISDLHFINSEHNHIAWISASVVNKTDEYKISYLNQIDELLDNTKNSIWILGQIWKDYSENNTNKQIEFYNGFKDVIDQKLS